MPEAMHTKSGPVRVLAFASGKGGVGKTNISVNLAVALAKARKSVMLMDADLGLANVDVLLGIRPLYDLHHVINGEKTLAEIIIEGPYGLRIVPAASGIGKMADLSMQEHAGLIQAFSEIEDHIDYLIIDTAAGISESVISFCKACQEVVVVVCDEPASITDAYALIKVLNQEHNVSRFQVLCNRVKSSAQGKNLFSTLSRVSEKYIEVSLGYLGSVLEDPLLREAQKKQQPVITCFPGSASSVSISSLAEKVQSLPVIATNSGKLEFFIERVIENNAKVEMF